MHARSKPIVKAIDRMLADAASDRPLYRHARPTWNVAAVRAAEEDLRALAADLRTGYVDTATVDAAHVLVTDGAGSPLFRRDPLDAARAVRRLRGAADAALRGRVAARV